MKVDERPIVFDCAGSRLLGILHKPQALSSRGVIVVVGGPQYRVGSHRQFLLLARYLAERGVAVFRFDYRGMGDSDGPGVTFESVGPDIAAAIDTFLREAPEVREIVLWGLCDAASAALMYAHDDPRIWGIVLVNPWVRSDTSIAKTHLKHYYLKRIFSAEFWRSLFSGRIDFADSVRNFLQTIGYAIFRKSRQTAGNEKTDLDSRPFLTRMSIGFEKYRGQVLLITSGDDYTAAEFKQVVSESRRWRELTRRDTVRWHELEDANHTFSRDEWRNTVSAWTEEWLRS